MDISENRYEIFNQPIRNKKIRLEIYDFNNHLLDTLETYVVSGTINIDADNDLRRSGSLEIVIPPRFNSPIFEQNIKDFNLTILGTEDKSYIWYDRYLKIYVGLEDFQIPIIAEENQKYQWYNMGCFLFDSPTEEYSSTTNSVSFALLDRMAEFGDQRQGVIPNITTEIPADTYNPDTKEWTRRSFREALVETLTNICGVQNYIIAPIPTEYEFLPYAIKISMGQTKLQVLTQFRDITPGWEFFFNEDGVFVYQPIPSGVSSPTFLFPDDQIISNNSEVDYSSIKNQIIIYGKTHETTFFAKSAKINSTELQLDFDSLGGTNGFDTSRFTQYSKIGFTWTNNNISTIFDNVSLWTNNFTTKLFEGESWLGIFRLTPYENKGGNYPPTTSESVNVNLSQGNSYVIKPYYGVYDENNVFVSNDENYSTYSPSLQWLGNLQVQAVSVNDNVNSPFYINRRLAGDNYYGGISTVSGSADYRITINDVDTLGVGLTSINLGTKITFIPTHLNTTISRLEVQSQGDSLDDAYRKPLPFTISRSNIISPNNNYFGGDFTIWTVELASINGKLCWYILGQLNAITAIYSDGEYNNIPSDYSAQIRADYELYLHSFLPHTINVSMVPNYLYNVNLKLRKETQYLELYTNQDEPFYIHSDDNEDMPFYVIESNGNFKNSVNYLIKKISFNLDSTGTAMEVTAMELIEPLEEIEAPHVYTDIKDFTLEPITVNGENGYKVTAYNGNSTLIDIPLTNVDGLPILACANLQVPTIIGESIKQIDSFSKNTVITRIDFPNTSANTTMLSYFSGCSNLKEVTRLDTSNVTLMGDMFKDCHNLTTIPQLDTKNVANMADMFKNCYNLTTIPLLDTSSLYETISGMFYDCNKLIMVPELDVHNLSLYLTFYGCFNLKSILITRISGDLDISSSTKFERSDLLIVLNNLIKLPKSSSHTLTMGNINLAKLTDKDKKIATDKRWVLK